MPVDSDPRFDQPDITIWKARWDALDAHLIALDSQITNNKEMWEHRADLLVLVQSLRNFGKQHFDFFYDGFTELDGATPLQISKEFPPDFVFRQVIHRVSEDFMVIQQCIQDRMAKPANPVMIEALQTADRLAYDALRPAIEQGILSDRTVVITYFEKKPSIRVIPYASVALVGIPLTSVKANLDYLALYHEVGHYVYRHGLVASEENKDIKVRVAQRMAMIGGEDKWLQRWKEELFADIYGSLTGGFPIALSFEYVENEGSSLEFQSDDAVHPISSIRPEIYLKTLEARSGRSRQELINKMRDRWTNLIKERSEDKTILPFLIMKTDQIRPDVQVRDTVLEKITDVIKQVVNIPELKTISRTVTQIQNVDLTSASIEEVLIPEIDQLVADAARPPEDQARGLVDGQVQEAKQIADQYRWEKWIRRFDLSQAQIVSIPEEKWLVVLDAGGWRTEGPHPRPDDDPG